MNPLFMLVYQLPDGRWAWQVSGVQATYEQAMRLGTAAAELAKSTKTTSPTSV